MTSSKRTGWPAVLTALAVISIGAIPAAAQIEIYDLGYSVTTQDVRADSKGTVHLIWTYGRTLYYGRIVDKAITGRVEVATGVSTTFWRPFVSARPDGGSVHIAWCQGGGKGNQLMHSWRNSSGVWRTESVYQVPSTQSMSMPTCAVDGAGQVHVLFGIYSSAETDKWFTLFYVKKSAAGAWGKVRLFAPKHPEHTFPMLFTDSTGRVHATWCIVGSMDGARNEAYYCTAPSGGSLSYDSKVKIPKGPEITLNGYGEIYVDHKGVVHRSIGAWSSYVGHLCIDHSKKPVGGSFSVPTRPSLEFLNLSHCDPVPAVVAAEGGQTIVAWGQVAANGANTVKASIYDPDKRTWALATVDREAGIPEKENAYKVSLTRTAKDVYMVWRGGNGHLKLLVMPLDGALPPDPPESPPPPEEGDPVAVFVPTPISGPAPLAVTFDGSASYDPDGKVVSYAWDFGDGYTGSGEIAAHTYETSGDYTASLTVTDDEGNTGSAAELITVGEPSLPPIADFDFSPSTGIYPCQIVFDAGRSRDPDGEIVQYNWSFGDGSRDSGRVVAHTYTRWGTFSVSLTVLDDSGSAANKVRTIEILRLYQPLNIRWETHKDESLFQTRYVNNVSWERNPANDTMGVQIILHRIWRKRAGESDLSFTPIGEVTADVFSYMDKDTGSDNSYAYTVTVRDSQGHESPIVGGGGSSGLIPSRTDIQFLLKGSKLGKK